VQTFDALPALTARHAYQLAANSFEASFVDAAQKQRWMAELDSVYAAG
jgi:adenine deaminase